MSRYIEHALCRFQYPTPIKPEHSPNSWQKPNHRAKIPFALLPNDVAALNATDKQRILEVFGTLLLYARGIDYTLLNAIGELATEQPEGTKTTMEKLSQLLNSCATHSNDTV